MESNHISYRCLIMATKMEKSNINLKDIINVAILKGLDVDTKNTLYNSNQLQSNKYQKEFRKIASRY